MRKIIILLISKCIWEMQGMNGLKISMNDPQLNENVNNLDENQIEVPESDNNKQECNYGEDEQQD